MFTDRATQTIADITIVSLKEYYKPTKLIKND